MNKYFSVLTSLLLLILGSFFNYFEAPFFTNNIQLVLYGTAYLMVGSGVVLQAFKNITKGDVFNEFFLMSLATLGAFAINEYAEGVAVMWFYYVGEMVQGAAVNRAKRSIASLLNMQVEEVEVLEDKTIKIIHPKDVEVGQVIQIKPGEKVPLDGFLLSKESSFNTAVLTGESKPDTKREGEIVLAGMVNLNTVSMIKVTHAYSDTKLSKILELVQTATERKAKTQRFINRFAKIYTPIVVFLAVAIVCIPYFVSTNYVFNDWLYRALVFLVISCPCALVISIPLGYFGGIGAASRAGVLFKGSDYLDLMGKVDTVVMDKTGTLTKGVFEVQNIVSHNIDETELMQYAASIEQKSTHPIAVAITECVNANNRFEISSVEEISGHGLKGEIDGKTILAGNAKLLRKFDISYPEAVDQEINTIVLIAIDDKYMGYIIIADTIKEDAKEALDGLKEMGVQHLMMLSGDKQSVVDEVSGKLGIDQAFGGLLPEDKYMRVSALKEEGRRVAFVGDGVNDAPVIKLADVGIAMGGLGSDAAIETADVVIQTDQPSKIVTAIKISKETTKIVWQNITLAFVVKAVVLILGAGGVATMWEAVFADVGVALLAILNATRIQKLSFK